MNGTRRPFEGIDEGARERARASRATVARALRGVLVTLLWGMLASASAAEESSRQSMQGLDEQVQEIKSDVLAIAAELSLLEEKLLYPSNTQLAVFVALGTGESFRLDSVEIEIDGERVARHLYSFKELEALEKGGVQRIYTGNVSTGDHRLVVSVAGKLANGDDLAARESFSFRKDADPKLVELTLADGDTGEARIHLGAP